MAQPLEKNDEFAIDPQILAAARLLIERDRQGHRIDIESEGPAHEVLENIAQALRGTPDAESLMTAFEGYATQMGAAVAHEAKATPLYARIMVTDRKPSDMPEYDVTHYVVLDGQRNIADGISRRVMEHTIHGTRTAATTQSDLETFLRAGEVKRLVVYFTGSSTDEEGQFVTIDTPLMHLAQTAGLVPAAQIELMKDVQITIQTTDFPPEAMVLLKDMAQLAETITVIGEPNEISPHERVELMREVAVITARMERGMADFILPPDVVEIVNAQIREVGQRFDIPVPVAMSVMPQPVAANDSVFQVTEPENLVHEIQAILTQDPVTPELRQVLEHLVTDIVKPEPQDLAIHRDALAAIAANENVSPSLYASIAQLLPQLVETPVLPQVVLYRERYEVKQTERALAAILEPLKIIISSGQELPPALAQLTVQLQKLEGTTDKSALQAAVLAVLMPDVRAELTFLPQAAMQTVPSSIQTIPPQVIHEALTQQVMQEFISERLALPPSEKDAIVDLIKSEGIIVLTKPDVIQTLSPQIQVVVQQFVQDYAPAVDHVMAHQMAREVAALSTSIVRSGPEAALSVPVLSSGDKTAILQVIMQGSVVSLTTPDILQSLSPAGQAYVQDFAQTHNVEAIQLSPRQIPASVIEAAIAPMLSARSEQGDITPILSQNGIASLTSPHITDNLAPAAQNYARQVVEDHQNTAAMPEATTMSVAAPVVYEATPVSINTISQKGALETPVIAADIQTAGAPFIPSNDIQPNKDLSVQRDVPERNIVVEDMRVMPPLPQTDSGSPAPDMGMTARDIYQSVSIAHASIDLSSTSYAESFVVVAASTGPVNVPKDEMPVAVPQIVEASLATTVIKEETPKNIENEPLPSILQTTDIPKKMAEEIPAAIVAPLVVAEAIRPKPLDAWQVELPKQIGDVVIPPLPVSQPILDKQPAKPTITEGFNVCSHCGKAGACCCNELFNKVASSISVDELRDMDKNKESEVVASPHMEMSL